MPGLCEDVVQETERKRLELEDNVSKLQASLLHWQIWDAEYEAFKEELLNLEDTASAAEMV